MKIQLLAILIACISPVVSAATVLGLDGLGAVSEASGNASAVGDLAPDHPAMEGIKAFNAGRHEEALRTIKPLADKNNPEALLIMGLAHKDGRGVEASWEKAVEYMRKSKVFGNKQAAYLLPEFLIQTGEQKSRDEALKLLEELARTDQGAAALILGEGGLRGWFGGEPDFESARVWWMKSSEKGEVRAMMTLGRLFDGEFGFPEKRDPKAALDQFLKVAALDNPVGMIAAGSRLLSGDEAIRNEKLGLEWIKKAISAGRTDGHLVLGDYEQSLGKEDRAVVHYREGAESGQLVCMVRLGNLLYTGAEGVEKDPEAALGWFKKAGESGLPTGHLLAARLLLGGEDKSKILEGYGHLLAAAQSGFAEAQNEIGMLYLNGRLGIQDGVAAAAWFGQASAGGFPLGSYNLATLLEQGFGVPQNFGEAGRLYAAAATAGFPRAAAALARLHANGAGTEKNLPKAWALLSLAVQMGDKDSEEVLRELASNLTEEQLEQGKKFFADFSKPQAKPE
ncbi:MAG: tetratricopeptide repeat protein [Akkermansiaceae bacterium]